MPFPIQSSSCLSVVSHYLVTHGLFIDTLLKHLVQNGGGKIGITSTKTSHPDKEEEPWLVIGPVLWTLLLINDSVSASHRYRPEVSLLVEEGAPWLAHWLSGLGCGLPLSSAFSGPSEHSSGADVGCVQRSPFLLLQILGFGDCFRNWGIVGPSSLGLDFFSFFFWQCNSLKSLV